MKVLILDSATQRSAAMHEVANAPDRAVVTIGDAPSSVAQRQAFWAIMQEIAEHLTTVSIVKDELVRHDAETWAEYFLGKYAPRREIQIVGGASRWIREPLARISAPAFGAMLAAIEADATDMGMQFHETRGTLDEWQAIGQRIARHVSRATS